MLVVAESSPGQGGAGLGAGRGRRGQVLQGLVCQVKEHVFYPTDNHQLYVCREGCLYDFLH